MTPITLTSHGHRIDTDPDKFGFLRQSNDLVKDTGFLENRIEEDEYLFFRDILDHAVISAARQEIVEKLDVMGEIDAGFPEIEAIDSGEIRRNTIGIKSYLKNLRTGTAYRKLCHEGRVMAFLLDAFDGGPLLISFQLAGLGIYLLAQVKDDAPGTFIPLFDTSTHVSSPF